ncbi:MAG: hypothetical protein HY438_02720 [DPANN group archaeon]|nr:hypothetical protein [DPANN group archaeon]
MVDSALVEKYRAKIESQLELGEKFEDMSYSREYELFKDEQYPKATQFYEKLCQKSAQIIKIQVAPKDAEKVAPAIQLAHLNVTPEGVYSFAYLVTFISIAAFMILGIVFFNLFVMLIGLLVSLAVLFLLPTIPKQILTSWRARASDQLVLAVLYIVIYMQHTANLERALKFVAEHMPPPISLDFTKLLWDMELKTYESAQKALIAYAETWRGWDNEFIDSVNLIVGSLYEPDPQRKKELLDQSVTVILDGTQDHMLAFAHNLQSPMEALHMLGIVLPVMGMVMLPMIGAFLGASFQSWQIILLYNIILPLTVYGIGTSVLSTRPAGSDESDVYKYIQQQYGTPKPVIFGKEVNISPKLLAGILFVLSMIPVFIYVAGMAQLTPEKLDDVIYGTPLLFISIYSVVMIGLCIGLYFYWSVAPLMKIKHDVEDMEQEFASTIFQLGERLQEHKPPEQAIMDLEETMQQSKVASFFNVIVSNITKLGVGLRDAIFNERYGAIALYPSGIIKSTMSILVEGAKKSPEVAGRSLITISTYLKTVHTVTERMKDLLADTTSAMQSQAKIFVPVISGIVVGLASLTVGILRNLSHQLQAIAPGGVEAGESAAQVSQTSGLLDIFQTKFAIPPYLFQLIVGIYLIQIVYLLSYLLSGVINGHDEMEKRYMLAKNLIFSTIFYAVITVAVVLLFNNLVAPISKITFNEE